MDGEHGIKSFSSMENSRRRKYDSSPRFLYYFLVIEAFVCVGANLFGRRFCLD